MSLRRFCNFGLGVSLKYPRFLIFGVCIIFVASVFLCGRLYQAGDLQDQLDPDLQTTKDLLHVQENFALPSGLIGIVGNSTPWSNHALCEIQNTLIAVQNLSPQVATVFSPFSIRTTRTDSTHLFYPTVLENPCGLLAPEQNLHFLAATPWRHVLADPQGEKFIFSLSILKEDPPGQFGFFNPVLVNRIISLVQQSLPAYKIDWLGSQANQFYTIEGMQQSQLLNLLILGLVVISFRISFGTWKSSILFLLTFLFILTVVFGGMGLLHQPIDIISISLFLILMVSSLEDFVFISRFQLDHPNHEFRFYFKRFIEPSFYTSLTSALGFGSLMISDLQGIRRFGAWAAAGTMIEWGTVFFLLPSFLIVFKGFQNWTCAARVQNSHFLKGLTMAKAPQWLARLGLLAIPLGLGMTPFFNLSQNPSEIFPKEHPMSMTLEYAKSELKWISEASLVFSDNILKEKKQKIVEEISRDPLVSSMETEEDVLRYLAKDAAALRRDLIKRDFAISPFADRYQGKKGESRALVRLNQTDTEVLNEFRKKVENLCPLRECYLVGENIAFADSSRKVIQTLYESLFLSLILVGSVLAYLCYRKRHSWREFVLILLSSFWGSFALLMVIYLSGIHLNIITCIVATVLVGLTGDNAVQFIFAGQGNLEKGIERRSAASVFCSLIMALIPLVFLGSYFDPPRTLGMLMTLGFLIALVGDVWLLRSLVQKKALK